MLKAGWWPTIWQTALAVIFTALVLFALSQANGSTILWAIGAGALSSSTCIVFASPHTVVGQPKALAGGYLIGTVVGVACHWSLAKLMPVMIVNEGFQHTNTFWVVAAVAVGISILIMVITDMLHPPAVGVSLVLVIDVQQYTIALVILAAVVMLTVFRTILDKYLKMLV